MAGGPYFTGFGFVVGLPTLAPMGSAERTPFDWPRSSRRGAARPVSAGGNTKIGRKETEINPFKAFRALCVSLDEAYGQPSTRRPGWRIPQRQRSAKCSRRFSCGAFCFRRRSGWRGSVIEAASLRLPGTRMVPVEGTGHSPTRRLTGRRSPSHKKRQKNRRFHEQVEKTPGIGRPSSAAPAPRSRRRGWGKPRNSGRWKAQSLRLIIGSGSVIVGDLPKRQSRPPGSFYQPVSL
jgi:hypothetical protein